MLITDCFLRRNIKKMGCSGALMREGPSTPGAIKAFETLSGRGQRAVVVTVIPVGMVQMPVDQVIDMIIVRYRRMTTVRAMNVVFVVALAFVGDAAVGVGVRDRDDVFVIVIFMGAVQVPVVQVSHMVPVPDRDVTAVRTVLMRVIFVDGVGHDSNLPTSGLNGYGRVGVVEDVPDERLHMGVCQAIEHVPAVAPARDEVLFQKDPQAL